MLLGNTPIGTVAYLGGLPAVLEAFCWSWGQLIQCNAEQVCRPGEYVHYDRATVSFHAFARNALCDRFLGEWLLMLDTDHAPEPDLLRRLLTARRMIDQPAAVLVAAYPHRTPPHSPVLYRYDEGSGTFAPIADWPRQALAVRVDSAGAGALLVPRGVLDRIRAELGEGPFDIRHPYGEDHSFFLRCRQLGIAVWALPHIESPHLVVRPLTLAHDFASPSATELIRADTEVLVLAEP